MSKYKDFNLDIPKMGHILLLKRKKGDFFNNSIYKKQLKAGFKEEEADYVHTEILGGGPDSMRIAPWRSRRINIQKEYKGRYIKIVKYRGAMFNTKYRYKIAYFYSSLCNLYYDFGGVVSFMWKFIKQSNRLFFCSEGCLWALQKVYPKALSVKPNKCYPADFLNKKCFYTVWEGIVQ